MSDRCTVLSVGVVGRANVTPLIARFGHGLPSFQLASIVAVMSAIPSADVIGVDF